MMKLVAAILLLGALAGPAHATSVADVLRAHAELAVLDTLPPDQYQSYRAAHAPALLAATAVLEQASIAYESVLATADAAFERYGVRLVCNFSEDAEPEESEMFDAFVKLASQKHGVLEAELRPKLLDADYQEMVSLAVLALFPCPGSKP